VSVGILELRAYLKPWSSASFAGNPPAARALSATSSTRSGLSSPSARIASVLLVAVGVGRDRAAADH